jgi:membrane protein
VWSASGGFSVLVRNINKAWPDGNPRSSIRRRFFGIGIVATLLLLLGMWFISNAILDVLPRFQVFGLPEAFQLNSAAADRLLGLVPLLFTFLMFLVLYRWVPNREVGWSVAIWSALAASVGWEISANLFNRYISSGLSNLDLVYGSLSAIVSFLIWVYIVSLVTLFCAHLGVSIAAEQETGA